MIDISEGVTKELINKMHRRLSIGSCRGCMIHIGGHGPSVLIVSCQQCDRPDNLKEALSESNSIV